METAAADVEEPGLRGFVMSLKTEMSGQEKRRSAIPSDPLDWPWTLRSAGFGGR